MVKIQKYELKLVRESTGVYDLDKKADSPAKAAKIIQGVLDLESSPVENFGILALDVHSNVIGVHEIATGKIDQCYVSAASVFRPALLNNAKSIILYHNHPSGSADPSPQDISLTIKFADIGKQLEIPISDHIIIGYQRYHSLREYGQYNP